MQIVLYALDDSIIYTTRDTSTLDPIFTLDFSISLDILTKNFIHYLSLLDPLLFLVFFVLVGLSAFFSGTELALMTVSKHAVATMIREKRFGAKSLETIKNQSDKLLITILIGNNIVNVATSALATMLTLKFVQDVGLPEESGIAISTAVVTAILLLFGEITPKTICSRYNEPISLAVAPMYRIMMIIFTPITILIEFFVKGIALLFGGESSVKKISYQEVEAFIDMSHEEGEVEADERRQIKNLLSLREMTAESVMTPRVNVEFLSLHMTLDEACDALLAASHSRLPVSGESRDDVEHILTFREAFRLKAEGNGQKRLSELNLEKIMKVPLTQVLDDLFEKFQKSRRHIALVLDEHGGTAGVVTMEDVMEEVFGDIKDETDREEVYMRKKSDGSIEAVGSVLIDDILEECNLHPEDIGMPEEYLGEPLSYIIMSEEEDFARK